MWVNRRSDELEHVFNFSAITPLFATTMYEVELKSFIKGIPRIKKIPTAVSH
jgi:hypothetical protein